MLNRNVTFWLMNGLSSFHRLGNERNCVENLNVIHF